MGVDEQVCVNKRKPDQDSDRYGNVDLVDDGKGLARRFRSVFFLGARRIRRTECGR